MEEAKSTIKNEDPLIKKPRSESNAIPIISPIPEPNPDSKISTENKNTENIPSPAHTEIKIIEAQQKIPSKDIAEQIEQQFVILDPNNNNLLQNDVNTEKIYNSWKSLKSLFAVLKDFEITRHQNLIQTKELLDNICESIFNALGSAINNNKNLIGYFTGISIGLKELSKQMSRGPEILNQIAEIHQKAQNPIEKLLNLTIKNDQNISKAANSVAKFVDNFILEDLKSGVNSYNKNVIAQREIYPKLAKIVDETETKIISLFHLFSIAISEKEHHILSGQQYQIYENKDFYLNIHEYRIIVQKQSTNIIKYAQFCENLIEDRRNLESMRVNSITKSLENYYQNYKLEFGNLDSFNNFLPSVFFILEIL